MLITYIITYLSYVHNHLCIIFLTYFRIIRTAPHSPKFWSWQLRSSFYFQASVSALPPQHIHSLKGPAISLPVSEFSKKGHHQFPYSGKLNRRRHFLCCNPQPQCAVLEKEIKNSDVIGIGKVSTSNFCLTTCINNYLLKIQLHDGLLKISHSTMDQFSTPAAGPWWEIISF